MNFPSIGRTIFGNVKYASVPGDSRKYSAQYLSAVPSGAAYLSRKTCALGVIDFRRIRTDRRMEVDVFGARLRKQTLCLGHLSWIPVNDY